MVGMGKEDRFWFGKVRIGFWRGRWVLERFMIVWLGCMIFPSIFIGLGRWRRQRRGLLESGLMVFLELVWMWVVELGGIRLGLLRTVLILWLWILV